MEQSPGARKVKFGTAVYYLLPLDAFYSDVQ
jgi:hypothetical protein